MAKNIVIGVKIVYDLAPELEDRLIMKTFTAKPETIQHNWLVVDATDQILGRLATEVASRLKGKHKPEYTPNQDTGDYIIVLNAEKIAIKGNNKAEQKTYYRHSEYPGGLKETSYNEMMKKNPSRVVELAIKGMLPKNPLGRAMYRKLKVYNGAEHKHHAQQPIELNLKG